MSQAGRHFGSCYTRTAQADGYPPYNIEQPDQASYQISLAVAGFKRNEMETTNKPDAPIVSGRKKDDNGCRHYLHRGISARKFDGHRCLIKRVRAKPARLFGRPRGE